MALATFLSNVSYNLLSILMLTELGSSTRVLSVTRPIKALLFFNPSFGRQETSMESSERYRKLALPFTKRRMSESVTRLQSSGNVTPVANSCNGGVLAPMWAGLSSLNNRSKLPSITFTQVGVYTSPPPTYHSYPSPSTCVCSCFTIGDGSY